MNNKDLLKAIGNAEDEFIINSAPKRKNEKKKKSGFIAAVAAVLAVTLIAGIFLYPDSSGGNMLMPSVKAIAAPMFPDRVASPYYDDYMKNGDVDWDAYDAAQELWAEEWKEIQSHQVEMNDALRSFFEKTGREIMSDSNGENKVYSPLNLYMALAILAETTDGSSRQQLLQLLGSESIEHLRKTANDLWLSNFIDDGRTLSRMGASLWLNENISFTQKTMELLADNYYAASFSGKPGSEDFDKALQAWLNEETGGLLENYASRINMPEETVLAIATTLNFVAKWGSEFHPDNTREGVFHSPNGDVTCDFMNSSSGEYYYWGENFSATGRYLNGSGNVWLILPDEGIAVEELYRDEEAMDFILSNGSFTNQKYLTVNLSLPKFDVSSSTELSENIKSLGITDIFDFTQSDFTPLAEDQDVFLSRIDHCARVKIDEEGVAAAAYTVEILNGTGAPPDDEVDFVLDRPFIFVITGSDGLPMFIGTVNTP